MKFSIKDFFSICDQIRSFLRVWSHLPKKPLMENFIISAVIRINRIDQRALQLIYDDYNEAFKKLLEWDSSCTVRENNIQRLPRDMFKFKSGLISEIFETIFVKNIDFTQLRTKFYFCVPKINTEQPKSHLINYFDPIHYIKNNWMNPCVKTEGKCNESVNNEFEIMRGKAVHYIK